MTSSTSIPMPASALVGQMEGLSLQDVTSHQESARVPLYSSFLGPVANRQVSSNRGYKEALDSAVSVYKIACDALTAIEKGHLEQFDALVSDRACQIRAIMVATAYQKVKNLCASEKKALNASMKVLRTLSCNHENKARKLLVDQLPAKSLVQIVQEARCDLSVSDSSLQLTRAFMLNYIKIFAGKKRSCAHCQGAEVESFQEQTTYTKLSSYFKNVANDMLVAIVDQAKKDLSVAAIRILRQDASGCSNEHTLHMISEVNTKLIRERHEIPCFYSLKAVLDVAEAKGIGLLIKSKRSEHIVEKSATDPFDVEVYYKSFVPSEITPDDVDKPVLVIEAMRLTDMPCDAFRQKLTSYDLRRLIDINAAAHEQYSDASALSLDEMQRLAPMASEIKDIQQLFYITHIFCEVMKRRPL